MRSIVLLIAVSLLGACKDEAPTPPPRKVNKGVDTTRIPVPNHSPEVMQDPGKPRRVTMKGSMEADLSGRRQHFVFFPRGDNAAVHFPDTDVSRVKLRGALSDDGSPSLSFTLDPLKLDTLEFPATFIAGAAKKGEPSFIATYEMGRADQWTSEVESEQPMRITLDSLRDRTLTGTFEGTLAPKPPSKNEPVRFERGTFSIEVRLTNIPRGEKTPTKTPKTP
ncbi:MAG: hypothetical protein KUG77_14795 [Nannocystaceae bacterium]|nr:hypothetical protein [Nannocystaceae bacterium]